ncbi:non-ribosomal peptide synthetase [Micromonospora sediminicola]|uniref:non-ribosomal peptide synthetase n=1 Tax=Micromonospora sediminicola TaxID=946078 RepID=UPI0033D587F9
MTTLSMAPRSGTPADLPGPEHLGHPLPDRPLTPVPDLVTAVAARAPSRPAVRCGTDEMTYAELVAGSSRIAATLTRAGVRRGDRVAVLADASTATVAAVLAVLRCGAAYVPLDPGQPDQRLAEILADAQVTAALVDEDTRARLTGTGLPLVSTALPEGGTDGAETPVDVPVLLTDPAYLIYTSGSTGEPKGVVVEHGQLAASTRARRLVYPGEPTFLLVSPLSFDSSVAGLWGTLTAGGCLIVATGAQVRDPEQLVTLIDDHRATHLLCIPSLYSYLLDAAARAGADRLGALRTAIVAGEALPQELVERHFAATAGRCELVNEYGPTEATVWSTYHRFTAPAPVTIGRPIPGARAYVLDERLRPVPVGEPGELYVAGAGVARGYHGRPDATARAFRDDPFVTTPGERMYRTGDLCRWTPAGTLEFLGRRDHQVKVRGHRIELAAVEAKLCALPGVREAVAVPTAGDTELVGFVLAPCGPAPDALRRQLADRVPAVMVPSRIVVLDRFPRTPNGKTDRDALRGLADAGPPADDAVASAGPGTTDPAGLAAQVSAAWTEVLQRDDVPDDVNFFDLGGHSLAMFRLRETLERRTGRRLSVVALFQHTTVAAQVALLRDGGDPDAADADDGDDRAARAQRARALRARRAGLTPQEAL